MIKEYIIIILIRTANKNLSYDAVVNFYKLYFFGLLTFILRVEVFSY